MFCYSVVENESPSTLNPKFMTCTSYSSMLAVSATVVVSMPALMSRDICFWRN